MSEDAEWKKPKIRIIPVPYMVLDAAMMEWYTKSGPVTDILDVTRQSITHGSCEYIIGLKERALPMAIVWLRAVNLEGTHLTYFPHPIVRDLKDADVGARTMQAATLTLQRFIAWEREEFNAAWMATESQRTLTREEITNTFPQIATDTGQSISQMLADVPALPRPRGRPINEHNKWARDEIALGRDRRDVFEEYLRRQHIDLEDSREVELARERFKKALSTKKGE